MKVEVDPASLSVGELVALVHELRHQVARRDQEIEQLRRLLPTRENTVDSSTEPVPGSVEDLLDQLERTYPLPKADG